MRSALIGSLLVFLLFCVGCGTLMPRTEVSPPENKITHQESAVKGGMARTRTTTITIETPTNPETPKPVITPAPPKPTPAPAPKQQSRAVPERAWWDVALDWILPGSPAYADPVRLPDGRMIDAKPGSTITITESESESKNDDTTTSFREGDTRGSGLSTNQPQKDKFDTGTAAKVSLGETGESSSTGKSTGGMFSASSGAMPSGWMYLIGALVMAGGVAIIVFMKDTKGGLITLAGGAAIAFVGYIVPTYGGWILLGLAVIGAAYFFFATKKGKELLVELKNGTESKDEVIDQVIVAVQKGIEALPKPTLDESGKQVGPLIDFLSAMSKSMDAKVKEFVKKYKAENGIG